MKKMKLNIIKAHIIVILSSSEEWKTVYEIFKEMKGKYAVNTIRKHLVELEALDIVEKKTLPQRGGILAYRLKNPTEELLEKAKIVVQAEEVKL